MIYQREIVSKQHCTINKDKLKRQNFVMDEREYISLDNKINKAFSRLYTFHNNNNHHHHDQHIRT